MSDSVDLTHLKRSRGGHSANVKRKHEMLLSLIESQSDISLIMQKMDDYEKAFQKFTDAHRAVTNFDIYTPSKNRDEHYQEMLYARNKMRIQLDHYIRLKDDVKPSDSVSNCSSKVSRSSSGSALAKASAKRAALEARANFIEEQHKLDQERLELEHRTKKLNLLVDISAADAEEKCLTEFDSKTASAAAGKILNPQAPPFIPSALGSSVTGNKKSSSPSYAPMSSGTPSPEVKNETSAVKTEMNQQFYQQLIDSITLPKTTIKKFDGEPTEFWLFLNSFDSIVDKAHVDDAIKLNKLIEYCEGKAAKVIHPCAFMPPTEGYTKARMLLKDRFGNDYVISDAWVKKVTNGGSIKSNDGAGLFDLADDVNACVNTLLAMGRLEELDNREKMIKILDRLPFFIVTRWRKEAVTFLQKNGKYPNISRLSEFLYSVAKELNDPVFGIAPDKDRQAKKHNFGQGSNASKWKTTSLNVQAGGWEENAKAVVKCYLCEQDHKLVNCSKFYKMSPEQKLLFVKENKLCFRCLGARSHIASQCRQNVKCNVDNCSMNHSSLLHQSLKPKVFYDKNSSSRESTEPKEDSASIKASNLMCTPSISDSKVALPIVTVHVRGTGHSGSVKALALLDTGSNKTFCCKELIEELGLKGSKNTLSIETLTNEVNDIDVSEVSLEVTRTSGKLANRTVVELPKVYVLSRFPVLEGSVANPEDVIKWDHLRDIKVPQLRHMPETKVSILIGQDVPEALIPLEVRNGRNGEPYAARTVLGWTLNGPMGNESEGSCGVCNFVHADADVSLERQVENFWKLDTDNCVSSVLPSIDDQKVVELWSETTKVCDGHLEMQIPFKEQSVLPDSRQMAEKRLSHLGKKLSKNPELHARYKTGISDLIKKGYAETVSDEELDSSPGRTWYLPHHSVVNPNKPDKLRIVFDCAAEFKGTSLNKNVFQGPDLANKLIGVLVRFRQNRVAVMGDIEAMFHQVKVSPDCRDSLRFLWWQDGDPLQSIRVYRMTVHLFGGIWSPSCANFALRRTAELCKDDYDAEIIDTVNDNFYVDDCLASFSSADNAVNVVHGLSDLLSRGGFHLTKWVSNNRAVVDAIPEKNRSKEVKGIDLNKDMLPKERALGVQWNTETDRLSIQISPKERPLTRRGLLSVMTSVYDPFGLVSPFVMKAKRIFQAECKSGRSWDDDLSQNGLKEWLKWLTELPKLGTLCVSRCFMPDTFGDVKSYELHHFSDASQDGYGAVSYLRMVDHLDSIHCSFVLAKSRLSPMKYVSIPRLELCAAVVAVKMDAMLRRELTLPLGTSTFWTDSNIVLQYIGNTSLRFHTFVANRVVFIHERTSPSQWRYVNTSVNPADDISRGIHAQELLDSSRWRNGPDFLWNSECEWPKSSEKRDDLLADDKEVKVKCAVHVVDASRNEDSTQKLIEKYSCWFKLKRAVAWFLRFRDFLRKKECSKGEFSNSELLKAETGILKYVQKTNFRNEIEGERVTRQSHIYTLEPFVDQEGLLRVGGRLGRLPTTEEFQHQVIIPRNHHIADLIVRHVHENNTKHAGRETVLASIRRKYWITKPRGLINRVLKDCVICKRLRGKLQYQRMADIPLDRLGSDEPAFANVGIDCFGPFGVKRGRSIEKRYGCIFTCLSMRAIHLEKLCDMSADSFINALTRFCARRGVPKTIRCDNGTNFVGGERELNVEFNAKCDTDKLKKHCLLNGIEWKFNPPAASHMGGSWERQIRTVRKVLNVVLRHENLDDERLETLFCVVESTVNSRPLTVSPSSVHDLEPLTPNHLLLLRPNSVRVEGKFVPQDVYTRRWRHVQLLADRFWNRWLREYIPTIQCRSKWFEAQPNVKIGDVVLVANEITYRNDWPLGRILEVFPDKDGLVRVVKVKTNAAILMRPVSKLVVLVSEIDNN